MNGRRAQLLGPLVGALAAVACSSPPLYPSNTGNNGGTAPRGSDSGGGSGNALAASGNSGTSGGNTAGETTTGGSTNGKPPGCQAACNLPGQFCDDAGQCVSCLDDQQCSGSQIQPHCYNDAGPYFGTCVECLVSSQCSQGEVCDSAYNCVAGCVQNTQACTGQTLCEPDSGTCVTCLSAAQCTNGLVCYQGTCQECKNDFQCYQNYPGLKICSPESNCVQCEVDLDCAQGQHCIGNHCQ